ncbi:hypothetical protein DFQ28_011755 [Apophysomyces sp. BC1034]|nr:hypothetical protein DFQ30_000238 [Apophysomyces sp. BC1015]KAG0168382.1 hypothetical protein DFQ29_010175 [Apophysomyces sp. BC1021]KAG0184114.1 hypothetical protein DFQ28_011755 [Apophysomyces sp. BC1034]
MKITACIAALLAVATFSTEAAPVKNGNDKLHVPLETNPHFKRNATAAVLKARAKFHKHLVSTVSDSSSGTIPMTDYQNDVEYYGTIEVGTPAQSLKLDFDTGSSDLWFASTLCSNCGNGQTKFDPSKSSTYKKDGTPWQIGYGDGSSASGVVGYDTVSLGGLQIKQQAIELAKQESSEFQSDPVDGLLGLGFDSINTVSVKTPVDNLISQNLISKPIFGVFLGKESNGGGGEYVFGGYDESHVGGTLTTVPVDNSQGFWGITVDGASVGGNSVGQSFSAIIDTGTTLLILTDDVAQQVASAYKAEDNGDGTYSIPCDTSSLQPLQFSIGGANFEVPPDSLVFAKQGGQCIAGFSGGGGSSFAILGDVFIKNNYVVFDQSVPQVQIAPVK